MNENTVRHDGKLIKRDNKSKTKEKLVVNVGVNFMPLKRKMIDSEQMTIVRNA